MIGIHTLTGSATGDMIIHEHRDSELNAYATRTTRAKTLDGGAVIVHSGFAHGDRTIQVRGDISETDAAKLRTITENQTTLYFALPDGFFKGVIDRLVTENGELDLTILIESKLSS